MTHENEYHDNMVKMLELIWGEGYMAPGGPGNVAKLLQGSKPQGKRILDIGCGLGGPALEMASTFSAYVTGIDLETPLIARASADAKARSLDDRCHFQTVSIGPLPFADESFDIVISSGALTQTGNKQELCGEIYRVLASGGHFSCYEWMGSGDDHSDDMAYWFEMEELSYTLETLENYGERFIAAGFDNVVKTDASDWYRREAQREYELIRGELYERMVGLLGKADADHFVENWRALTVVCSSGELLQGYCRGRK
jgi:phosphoethanolamine N-methyltransferase